LKSELATSIVMRGLEPAESEVKTTWQAGPDEVADLHSKDDCVCTDPTGQNMPADTLQGWQ
jgi:hypothetical protein